LIRMIYADGNRSRMEMGDGHIAIRDGQETVMIDEQAKTVTKLELIGLPANAPSQPTSGIDLINGLKSMSSTAAEPLGEKEIDGVAATGFKSTWGNNGTIIAWADKKTADPVRVEMSMTMAGKAVTVVMDHFDMSPTITDDTFSTKVPEGYKVVTQKMDVTNVTQGKAAESVAAVLGAYADASEGSFPATLDDWASLMKMDEKTLKPAVDPQLIGAMSAQLFSMPGGYHYTGKGVKKGDKTAVIFWYTPKDAKLSRAVYGDLHIDDVETAKLPTTNPVK
jgi:outer membrane lipoprotein-sorting protein